MQLRVSGLCEDQWILHPGISLAAREQISNCGSLVGISMPEKYSFVCNDCLSYHAVDTLVTRKASMWVYLIICVFVCARQLDVLKISWTLGHVMMCWKVRRRFFLSLRTECVKVSSSTEAKERRQVNDTVRKPTISRQCNLTKKKVDEVHYCHLRYTPNYTWSVGWTNDIIFCWIHSVNFISMYQLNHEGICKKCWYKGQRVSSWNAHLGRHHPLERKLKQYAC